MDGGFDLLSEVRENALKKVMSCLRGNVVRNCNFSVVGDLVGAWAFGSLS